MPVPPIVGVRGPTSSPGGRLTFPDASAIVSTNQGGHSWRVRFLLLSPSLIGSAAPSTVCYLMPSQPPPEAAFSILHDGRRRMHEKDGHTCQTRSERPDQRPGPNNHPRRASVATIVPAWLSGSHKGPTIATIAPIASGASISMQRPVIAPHLAMAAWNP